MMRAANAADRPRILLVATASGPEFKTDMRTGRVISPPPPAMESINPASNPKNNTKMLVNGSLVNFAHHSPVAPGPKLVEFLLLWLYPEIAVGVANDFLVF